MSGKQAKRTLPQGGGEMGERIRAFDWAKHPLGPPDQWPAALHDALRLCLNSTFPTAIYWGRDLYLFYNDAWSPIPAERHPGALAKRGADVWTDIWSIVGPQFENVLDTGTGFAAYDQMLPMERGGRTTETYWNYSITAIYDEHGEVVGIFNQGNETTAAIVAARMREEEKERLRDLFAQAPGAIAVLRGPQHEFYIANEAYFELSGRSRDILGRKIAEALPEVVEQGFVALLDKVYQTGEPFIGFNVPVELVRKGELQTRIIDFIYHPTRDLEGHIDGIFVQATDVTDRSRAETALQELNATLEQRVAAEVAERMRAEEQLRQAHKMDAIGQLTGGIAHDFNNMLAVVIGALNLMQRRLAKGDTDVTRYIDAATDGANRASQLTQRLLAFSRQQPLNPSSIDANKLVASMTELLSRTLGEHIQIETVLSAGLWRTFADQVQLESAIINLGVNARDAMGDGGKLTIETANGSVDAAYGAEHGLAPGQYVMICVTDTGAGMDAETMAQAFDPFFTTKEVGKGTGLGLSQVFGFVRKSGGHVKLYSELGHGTTVKIYLPRFYGADEIVAPELIAVTRDGSLAETVLVVEDDPRVRAFSTEALRELGYTVLSAVNGPDALRQVDGGAKIDLLFTDMVMPEMNGRQLAEAVLARLPRVKVVFTTGYAPNAAVHNGVLEPNMIYLHKPFTLDQLAEKIRAALDA
ncbi:MAG: response regulator [Alphaproteobacteria bacterium]|nr:response regulator [Alphaproteobacteria bacterium]